MTSLFLTELAIMCYFYFSETKQKSTFSLIILVPFKVYELLLQHFISLRHVVIK